MNMRSVGQLLKETREAKDLSIRQISQVIKIRESLIESLELGDYDSFTSDMHLKSFLRSYASYLGINEEKIMALYRRERQIQIENEAATKGSKYKSRFSLVLSKFINLKGVVSLFALSGVVIAILFFYSQWKAFNQPPRLEIISPKQGDVLTSENFVIEGFTGDPGVKVLLDGNEATYVDAELGKFKINGKFNEPGLKRFQVIAENQFQKKTIQSLDLKYDKPADASPTPTPTPVKAPNKVRFFNKSTKEYKVSVVRDKKNPTAPEQITVPSRKNAEVEFTQSLDIKNLDKTILDIYINNATTPETNIEGKEYSILIP
jgi:cytoskeletal protein RodZ